MFRRSNAGGFLLSLLLTMALNLEWLLPAVLLVVFHFTFGWSRWWAALAAGLWLLWVVVAVWLLGLACRVGNAPQPQTENKNPYSKKTDDVFR